jgi:hypothetical protein
MARTLYRIYLYTVWMILLLFATGATAAFLAVVLRTTGLDSNPRSLSQSEIVQPAAFAVIAWLIAATLGGFHYWLIRRDIAQDPAAGQGPVRALYLNLIEAIAALVAVIAIGGAIASLGYVYSFASAPIAIGLSAAGLFALLELERRRTRAAPGGALTLQRLHFYGVQAIILLFVLPPFWLNALGATVARILLAVGAGPAGCSPDNSTSGSCYEAGFYITSVLNLASLWAAVAWLTFALLAYGLLSARDMRSIVRLILHFLGFAYGIGYVLQGLDRALELSLRAIFGLNPQPVDVAGRYDFIAPAVVGLVVVMIYAFWLARDAHGGLMGAHALGLTVQAVTSIVLAVPFWVGVGLVLDILVEGLAQPGQPSHPEAWARALALALTGVAYIPFSLRLRQRTRTTHSTITTPRKGLVLALLALGTLTIAAGLVTALFAVATNAFGAPISNWDQVARTGLVSLVVGATVAGIYLFLARNENWIAVPSAPLAPATPATPVSAEAVPPAAVAPAAPPPPTAAPGSIEAVLDALLAGSLTRDQAAAAIRSLSTPLA